METEVERFARYLVTVRAAAAWTVSAYRSDLGDFIRSAGKAFPARIGREQIRNYLAACQSRGLSPRTIRRRLACLKAFYHWRALDGKSAANPFEGMAGPKLDSPLPKYLTQAEVAKMLSLPDLKTVSGRRDAALMEAMYSTGCRPFEAVQILQGDIDTREVFIHGKAGRNRRVPIGHMALQAVRAYLDWSPAAPGERVFRAPGRSGMTTRTVGRIVAGYLARIGHPELSVYVLRHSCATHILECWAKSKDANKPRDILPYIHEILGHSSISQTQVYLHVQPGLMRDAYQGIDDARDEMDQTDLELGEAA